MKLNLPFPRALRRSQIPTLSLFVLLQRTPVAPLASAIDEYVISSPLGQVLKSAAAIAASLGAMNSLAGATPLVPSTGTGSGITLPAGTAASVSFTVTPTQTPIMSWKVGGSIPPGMDFSGLTASGSVDVQNIRLEGTPTTAGAYAVSLQAFAAAGNTSFASATYGYTITITGSGPTASAPAITTQPLSQTVAVGASVTFSVQATGSPAPTFQWRKGTTDIAGATSASLALSNVQTTDAGSYTVVATNSAGSATSSAATLTVNPASGDLPGMPDKSGAFASGATEVTLTWTPPASGGAPSSYRIERAGDTAFATPTTFNTTGAVTSYQDTSAAAGTTYYYRVSAVNTGGVSPPTAAMQVTTPSSVGSGRTTFVNIATRAYCSTGNNVTIGGFVISGSGPKRVLIRAVGPSLTAQGIGTNEVLADPMVEVHHGANVVASNDNWGDNPNAGEITTVSAQIGANPLAGGDTASAALLISLNPGVYSFIVSGKNGTSGIVLLEVYDADTATTGASFVNIASRADATTGNGVTIGGFVISGSAPKRVLIRAIGETLTTEGIGTGEVLADPVIELHRGAAVIAVNDDWGTSADPSAIMTNGARIGATPIDAADTKSAAMLLRLLPGVYSFIASGKSGTSGVVLVEVYDAD